MFAKPEDLHGVKYLSYTLVTACATRSTPRIRQNDSSARGPARWWLDRARSAVGEYDGRTKQRRSDNRVTCAVNTDKRRGIATKCSASTGELINSSRVGTTAAIGVAICIFGDKKQHPLVAAGVSTRGRTMYVCHREELPVCSWDTGFSRRNADNNPGAP
ncbi:hypothetical protein ALC53_12441 [Atta colombica]|uniref:Uncharacterized protein n=1 Tax=Atta colombica TaxID=520822 RepID=A0A195AY66_9HYME|nr:hypothetical protein ALC53_12441 [Atta colombica]